MAKEVLQERAALQLKDTAGELTAVVEFGVLEQVHEAARGAVFGGEAAEHDAAYARVHDGARAHGAGLFGDVEVAVRKAPVLDGGFCLGDGEHFSVGGGVLELLDLVVGARDDAALADQDGTDGDFVLGAGTVGEAQGFAHEIFVALEIDDAVFHEIGVKGGRSVAQKWRGFEGQMRGLRRSLWSNWGTDCTGRRGSWGRARKSWKVEAKRARRLGFPL